MGRFGALFGILVFSSLVHAQENTSAVGTSVQTLDPSSTGSSKWGVSFFSLGSLTQKQIETGGSSYGLNGYLSLNYKLSRTRRVAVRPVFNVNSEGLDKKGKRISSDSSMGDAYLVYADKEIATLGPLDVSSSFRWYLPTSEFSQQINAIGKFRPETFITYKFGKYSSVSWVIKPDFYVQSQTTYEDQRELQKDGGYRRKTTQFAALEHYLELSLDMNQYLAFKPSAGFKEDWYNSGGSSSLQANHNTSAKIGLGLDIRPMRNLSFLLIAENLVKLNDRKDDVTFFRPEDNSLVLITNASL